jgi:quercetin dioxygenase-like cupin family protein
MRKASMLIGALTVAFACGAPQEIAAQDKPTVKRTELQRIALEELGNREGLMYTADFPAGGVAPRHFHPGPEFIYVLQGTLVLQARSRQSSPMSLLHSGE